MRRAYLALTGLLVLAMFPGCSSDDSSPAPTATLTVTRVNTPTVTATRSIASTAQSTIPATATPTQSTFGTIPATSTATHTATASSVAAVSGLVVVRGDFRASPGDALGAPPAEWMSRPGSASFDRALSFAAWRVDGSQKLEGATNADGSFSITGLSPGSYRLELSKTVNGNLLGAIVPFHVGDDGRADLVIEVAQGQVRWSNVYCDDDAVVRETSSPNGSRLVTRDGVIVEIGAPGRAYVDDDGDGTFTPTDCSGAPPVWLCNDAPACGEGRLCSCLASCPGCEDCPTRVCVPPSASGSSQLHRCTQDSPCGPNEKCVCISSCPACDDCAGSACVPTCSPANIAGIELYGPSSMYVGRTGYMNALARLSDGWSIDVTYLVDWDTSDKSIVAVDAWGSLSAGSVGSATITAKLDELRSNAWPIEVAARPALRNIYLQNVSCQYPYGMPEAGPDGTIPRPLPPDVILPPDCRQVVRVGGTIQFFVLGQFDEGYYEDITSQVTWELDPATVGGVTNGLFKGLEVGTASLRARLGEIASDSTTIKVVEHPSVVALQIYPLAVVSRLGPPPPSMGNSDAPIPCYDCGYTVTILKNDRLPFQATAAYDTGDWEDVTARVTWSSANTPIASIDTAGVVTGTASGDTTISATLDEISSNSVVVRVVESATLVSLSIYQETLDRVVAKGDQVSFKALGYYDIGFEREATNEVVWKSSNETIGGFDRPGVFVGRSAGNVEVWAEQGEVESNHLPLEVFQTSTLGYCDDNNVNRGEWSDAFNHVVLETDCAVYSHPDVATLRFSVTEREHPGGLFDPCLDLYVFRGNRKVRTIREEGCGEPFLPPSSPGYDEAQVRYQTLAFWDLKDDRGAPVPPGTYTIHGRFYLYYDPVISLKVVVTAPGNRIPCEPNSCGNGCGYVRACGDVGPPPGPAPCPSVCTSICECPPGWGITEEGDCEPCAQECCPQGAACLPGTPTCEPPPVCCPEGKACIPELPPCKPSCCPFGAMCGALDLVACECCPDGAACIPELPPCTPPAPCCPKDALCILPLPTCGEDCCPPGAQCAGGLVPCDQLMCCLPDGSCLPSRPPCHPTNR